MGVAGDRTLTIKNCFSSANILGTYVGGILGRHNWNATAAQATNCYYRLSNAVINSVGGTGQSMNATAVEKLTETEINVLNKYIEDDPDGLGTTGWAKWIYNKDNYPTLDTSITWNAITKRWEKINN